MDVLGAPMDVAGCKTEPRERQTEDLKVPGSMSGLGILLYLQPRVVSHVDSRPRHI